MKRKLLPLLMFFLAFGNMFYAQTSQITIAVEGNGFEKRGFENGVIFFTNRAYTIENRPTAFAGFEFLASDGKLANEGTITPSADGKVYIIAPTGGLADWDLVPNSEFNYSDTNKTALAIYEKNAIANISVPIPLVTAFPGASPIAKNIEIVKNQISVRGELVDIMDVVVGAEVFPQNNTFKFRSPLPSSVAGKKYGTSLIDHTGISHVRSNKPGEIMVATHYNTVNMPGWSYTGESFAVSSVRNYYIYTYQYITPGEWLEIPQPLKSGTVAPTLVFSDIIEWENPLPLPDPGIVITRVLAENIHITNPSITILPDGDYLAACTGALRESGESSGVSFFLSKDQGKTWAIQSANNGLMSYQNLFVHKKELYVLGTNAPNGDIIIRKSQDKGITWTYPTADGENGWLKTGSFHSAPTPVVVHKGRIWRGFEEYNGGNQKAFLMSASVDADLLKASSWSYTNSLESESNWVAGKNILRWIEGNAVVDRDGNVVNVLKLDEQSEGGMAAIATSIDRNTLTFDPSKDIIEFPGGSKKFTIRYDKVSDKYWTLSNAIFEEDRLKTHAGIYKNGVHSALLRNRLVLMHSDDLRNWTIKDTLISSENPFFHGFQYADWQIEGEDIISVIRTAYEDKKGLPERQHDANHLTFYRFKDFRNGLDSKPKQKKDKGEEREKTKINVSGRNLYITPVRDNPYDISIYDLAGLLKYEIKETRRRVFNLKNYAAGIYIVKIRTTEGDISKKIILPRE